MIYRPGVHVHRTGGHSAGLQFVSVHTKRGWVVLASDSSHYYEHMESYRPFSIAFHVGEMMASIDRLKKVAPSPQHIIPGHDPLVMARYPVVAGTDGLIVRLDEDHRPKAKTVRTPSNYLYGFPNIRIRNHAGFHHPPECL